VAIEDILARIAADAGSEAAAILAAAQDDARRVVGEAKARSDADAAVVRAREHARAAAEASALTAGARLRARDAALTARVGLAQEALRGAVDALVALPDAEYAALIARGVAQAGAGGGTVLVGGDDASRLRPVLAKALAAEGVTLPVGDGRPDVARGVVVIGDGLRVEVSPASLVEARRDELLALADGLLFPREGEAVPRR
jgi:vacuolar-type H+-ATPase subunit E/Vma4